MARQRDPGTVRVSLLGDVFTPLAAIAVGRLTPRGWQTGRIAADDAKALRTEAGGKIVSVAKLLDQPDCDIAIVGSPVAERIAHAERLLVSGVSVVLAPCPLTTDHADRLATAADSSGACVMIGDPFPTSPAIQQWMRDIPSMNAIDHVSGTVTVADDSLGGDVDARLWSMVDVVRFTAIQAGWGQVVGSATSGTTTTFTTAAGPTVAIGIERGSGPPRWELQAAGPDQVLRLSMLPSPEFERSGDPVDLDQPHPSVAFGIEAMLRTFAAQIASGDPIALDPRFAVRTTTVLDGTS